MAQPNPQDTQLADRNQNGMISDQGASVTAVSGTADGTYDTTEQNLINDLVQIHGSGIHDTCAVGTVFQNGLGNQRPGVETDRTAGNDVPASQGQKIGRAGSGTDEVYGHVGFPSAKAQLARRSCA